ncbi:hypothetical protein GCM10022237_47480 [Nocardioides ginsengisoli]
MPSAGAATLAVARWVLETHAGEFVGDCGLTMQDVEGDWLVEAGWHVRAPFH